MPRVGTLGRWTTRLVRSLGRFVRNASLTFVSFRGGLRSSWNIDDIRAQMQGTKQQLTPPQ